MKKKALLWLATIMMAFQLVILPELNHSYTISAQEPTSLVPSDIETIDTSSSIFSTVDFQIIDAELPSDRIAVDENSIYSENYYDISEYYDEIVIQQELAYTYMPKDHFRDITTYVGYYIFWEQTQEVQLLAPINISTELLDIFTLDSLINALWADILVKNYHGYNYIFTDDLLESYGWHGVYTPQMMADVKADMMRAEDIMATVSSTVPNYEEALEWMDMLYQEYEIFERRYNFAMQESNNVIYEYSENATVSEISETNISVIEEALSVLPDHLLIRLHYIGIVPPEELPTSWNHSDIAAFATTNLEMYFTDKEYITLGLFFHEVGHVVDFSTTVYDNISMNDYESLSSADDWQVIHNTEWAEEGSYYNTEVESFAQAFGAYALEYYYGLSMNDVGYSGYGLENRPQSYEYFVELFEALDY